MPLAGKQLSYLETARLAHKAGVPLGEKLAIAVAVAEWESRRHAGAWNFNTKTKDKSYGIWQINMLGALKADRLKRYGLKDAEELYKPEVNARIMADMSKNGENWKPWGAYKNGNFKKSLADARKAVAQLEAELKKAPVPVVRPVKVVETVAATKEPVHNYTRTSYGGRTVNQRTKDMLESAARSFGKSITLTQGSYNKGVGASAGTHDGGGVVDISVLGMSASQRSSLEQALRRAGFFAWIRTPAQGFSYHIHAVAIGDKQLSSAARGQVAQGFADRDGLARRGPDASKDPYPAWVDKYGKHVSLDRPKEDELPGVSLKAVKFAATHRASEEPEHGRRDVRYVQDALVATGHLRSGNYETGVFDVRTKEAYQRFQEQLYGKGPDADGVPGQDSLTKLGQKVTAMAFRVVS